MEESPAFAGHRITVANIVIWHERLGKSADEIATEYDLTLADVYAALAFYFDNREAIEESIAKSKALVSCVVSSFPVDYNPSQSRMRQSIRSREP